MKNSIFLFCLLALVATACKPEPEPGVEPVGVETNDTTETMVKKYLVKEYYANAPDQPIRLIEWSEDFSKIKHITTHQNTYFQLDFSFEYYGNDSMRVVLSKPDYSAALVLFSNYTCFFDKLGRISKIDYFANSEYKSTQKYNYDSSGKLISVRDEEHDTGYRFVWDGDNACEIYLGDTPYIINGFSNHYHPYYSFPYLLLSGDGYNSQFLTMPLWKNWFHYNPNNQYKYDEEGYVTCEFRVDEQGNEVTLRTYEYSN